MNKKNRILQPEQIIDKPEKEKKQRSGFPGFLKTMGHHILLFFKRNYFFLFFLMLVIVIPVLVRIVLFQTNFFSPNEKSINPEKYLEVQAKIIPEISSLDKKLAAKTPKSYYLIINSASNEFTLYKGVQLLKKDKCSTGSYVLLKNDEQQQWMFKTPKGEFKIQGKTTSPVWKKPDWAFVEEGLPVPTTNHHTRFEYGVLGDYALNLGRGYLIHGTLYQRFIGLPVTHGCIRLNDENLELVYKSLSVGSKVYIY